MTVNTTKTRELNIDTIVRRAYQLAGLVPAEQGTLDNAKATLGRDFLEMLMDELQASIGLIRQRVFESVAAVADTASYAMPAHVLNVVGDATYKVTGEDTETVIKPMSMQDYTALSDKAAEGVPSSYFIHRATTMTLYLWPVPVESGTLRLQIHTLLGDNDNGTNTLDLERHWVSYVTYALAARLALASSLSMSIVSKLESLADARRDEAARYSSTNEPTHMVLNHRTPWNS